MAAPVSFEDEVLGYKALVRDFRPLSVLDATLPLSGCLDLDCNRTSPSDVSHIALESWIGAYGADYEVFAKRHPAKAPVDLGTIGWAGEEALYVPRPTLTSAYEESGIALEFYKSYSPSHNDVRRFFDSPWSLPADAAPVKSS
ncbi:hypothetical protein AK812_SmicGene41084 [Symbiodinium microadriaticum]|uniref:Uncharacterized protein n=1 Tax=Symbiodinium microadriaticum TaxID=2951 RepID=A0A1Q9C701_SYMMI|nr:hypothetical protein AK812_SmicGene41084 [Symbiodinium microadriaticum]